MITGVIMLTSIDIGGDMYRRYRQAVSRGMACGKPVNNHAHPQLSGAQTRI